MTNRASIASISRGLLCRFRPGRRESPPAGRSAGRVSCAGAAGDAQPPRAACPGRSTWTGVSSSPSTLRRRARIRCSRARPLRQRSCTESADVGRIWRPAGRRPPGSGRPVASRRRPAGPRWTLPDHRRASAMACVRPMAAERRRTRRRPRAGGRAAACAARRAVGGARPHRHRLAVDRRQWRAACRLRSRSASRGRRSASDAVARLQAGLGGDALTGRRSPGRSRASRSRTSAQNSATHSSRLASGPAATIAMRCPPACG